ncbi:MAG: hypothetical protein IKN29_08680 [Bacteroidales bacterium]|nr:hypothetical protein [Bacteroidales bacterium]
MGNRFREKVTEEGLDGKETTAREAAAEAAAVKTEKREERGDEKEVASDEKGAESGERRRSDKVAKGISKVLGGDILGDKLVLKQIPLMLLCLFFLLLIVANRYKVESLSRDKIATQERIDDLREHRIQMQKQYQKSVKISQIAENLGERGVGITSGPPYEIEN